MRNERTQADTRARMANIASGTDPDDVHTHLYAYAGMYLAALWHSWLRRARTTRTPALDEAEGPSSGEGAIGADGTAPAAPEVRRQLFPAVAAASAGSEQSDERDRTVWAAAVRHLPPTLRALDPLAQRAVAVLLVGPPARPEAQQQTDVSGWQADVALHPTHHTSWDALLALLDDGILVHYYKTAIERAEMLTTLGPMMVDLSQVCRGRHWVRREHVPMLFGDVGARWQLVLGAASHLRHLSPRVDGDAAVSRIAMRAAHRAYLLAVPPLRWFLPRTCAAQAVGAHSACALQLAVVPGPEHRSGLLEQVVALVETLPPNDTSIVYVVWPW